MSTRRFAPGRGAMTRSTPRRPAAEELEEEDNDEEEFDYSDPINSAEADEEDVEEEDFQFMPSRSSPVTMIFTFPPRGNFFRIFPFFYCSTHVYFSSHWCHFIVIAARH